MKHVIISIAVPTLCNTVAAMRNVIKFVANRIIRMYIEIAKLTCRRMHSECVHRWRLTCNLSHAAGNQGFCQI